MKKPNSCKWVRNPVTGRGGARIFVCLRCRLLSREPEAAVKICTP